MRFVSPVTSGVGRRLRLRARVDLAQRLRLGSREPVWELRFELRARGGEAGVELSELSQRTVHRLLRLSAYLSFQAGDAPCSVGQPLEIVRPLLLHGLDDTLDLLDGVRDMTASRLG